MFHSSPATSRTLGQTNIPISPIGLGCVTFGREINEEVAFEIMDCAVERGIRVFDTAESYGGGQARAYRREHLDFADTREVSAEMHSSEKIVGRWLRSRGARNEVTLVTKATKGFSSERLSSALSASLERLQTDYVDLYLLHSYDFTSSLLEAVAGLDRAIKAGKVRAGGCSNFAAAQFAAALELSQRHGYARFEAVEDCYNLLNREVEADLLPLAESSNISVLAYSPLAAGFLTGKYTPDRKDIPKESRFDVMPGHIDLYFSERNFKLVDQLHRMAARIGLDPVQLALAWVFQQSAISTVLVGARTKKHLENAISARHLAFQTEWRDEIGRWLPPFGRRS